MDFATIRRTSEQFIMRNFSNVVGVRITEIATMYSEGRWMHKAIGLASIHSDSILPNFGTPIQVELLIAGDDRVVGVQGQKWDSYQRAHRLQPKNKRR